MKNNWKRFLAMLLSIAMFLQCTPALAGTADLYSEGITLLGAGETFVPKSGDNVTYHVTDFSQMVGQSNNSKSEAWAFIDAYTGDLVLSFVIGNEKDVSDAGEGKWGPDSAVDITWQYADGKSETIRYKVHLVELTKDNNTNTNTTITFVNDLSGSTLERKAVSSNENKEPTYLYYVVIPAADLVNKEISGLDAIKMMKALPVPGGYQFISGTGTIIRYTERTFQKVWDDYNNIRGKRPESITVTAVGALKHNSYSQDLTAENDWICVFKGMVEDDYSFTETMPAGFDDYYSKQLAGNILTNTLKTYSYSVEYYYDGVIDDNETETYRDVNSENYPIIYGDVINEYEEKGREGYRFDHDENLPLTIEDDNGVIKVYYVSNSTEFTVNKIWDDNNN